jgi:pimeloyl-ACP methyl ester carboxylesterase
MIFYLLATFLLIVTVAIYFIGPYPIIRPMRSDCAAITDDPTIEAVTVKGWNDIELDGYWYHVDNPRATILLLHGVGSCKEVWQPTSEWLAKIGIETLAFDSRAHGRSGGDFMTFGHHEKEDIKKVLDFIDAVNLKRATSLSYPPIGIFGNSLGGAIALQTMGIDDRIQFGIIESTFARLDEVVFAYMKRTSGGWGFKFTSDLILKRAGELAGFDPDLVRPQEAVKSVHQPVFLAHGDADSNIPVANAHLNFDNLASADKELVIVPGADHWGLYSASGEEYQRKLVDFIERQIRKKG